MDIGEVARRAGVPVSTLRFYEQKGLIASTGRRGLRRLFDPGVLDRLALIALARTAGFSLDEIGGMFTPGGQPSIDWQVLADKADELDETIRRLTAMRDGLRHAAVCPAPSHLECPTFQRLLGAAASGALGARAGNAAPGRRPSRPHAHPGDGLITRAHPRAARVRVSNSTTAGTGDVRDSTDERVASATARRMK
jgi:DNA-binding transcriptional MerR regulator